MKQVTYIYVRINGVVKIKRLNENGQVVTEIQSRG